MHYADTNFQSRPIRTNGLPRTRDSYITLHEKDKMPASLLIQRCSCTLYGMCLSRRVAKTLWGCTPCTDWAARCTSVQRSFTDVCTAPWSVAQRSESVHPSRHRFTSLRRLQWFSASHNRILQNNAMKMFVKWALKCGDYKLNWNFIFNTASFQ